MQGDLPKLRDQLKRKLPKLLREEDTISIIWFSGQSQCGVLLEAEPVATLPDLQSVEQAIDRWLRPVGLTAFKEPIELAQTVIQRVAKKRPGSVGHLIFLSDGADNQCPRSEIIATVSRIAGDFAATTIVEYGYYADRPLLSAMSECAGGAYVFAEDFDRYAPLFEAALTKRLSNSKRISVPLEGDVVGRFAFALRDRDLLTYAVEGNRITVPEDTSEVWYLSPARVGTGKGPLSQLAADCANTTAPGPEEREVISATYAAVSLFSVRMQPNVVYPLLKALGDVQFLDAFEGLFGKQRYGDFQQQTQAATFGTGRYLKGFDSKRSIATESPVTVLDVLRILASDHGNRVLLDHPDFKYSRVSRGRALAEEQLTSEEQDELAKLTAELDTTKQASRVKDLNEKIAKLVAAKPAPLRFEPDASPEGYPVSSLTFNESRPNVSMLIRKPGHVDVSKHAPADLKLPPRIPTFVFRNYTIIVDGLLNIDKLPVLLTKPSLEALTQKLGPAKADVLVASDSIQSGGRVTTLNLRALPLINRQMVKALTARAFFSAHYALLKAKAEQKVINGFAKDLLPDEPTLSFAKEYGIEAAGWLKERGFKEASGFAPNEVQAESRDSYLGKELKVSFKGLSKLPSLKEVADALIKGRLTPAAELMAPTVRHVEDFLASPFLKGKAKSDTVTAWLEAERTRTREVVRRLSYDVAQLTATIVIGQTWFEELSLEDSNYLLPLNDSAAAIQCSVTMKDIEVRI